MADKAITIPKGWKMTTLGGVAEKIAMGPFGSNIKIETFVDEGVPVISGTHLNGHKLEDKDYNFITSEHADKLKSSIVFADDIIFTHAGNIGQVAYIPKNSKYKKYILSQRQFFLRPKKDQLQTEYLTYFFKTREGQHKLLANANQTGVPSIAQPASYLKSIEINLPPLPEQCAIAAVLSSLDDKIELLREQNKTLEATAQAIFKEWFVNFKFPGSTGKMIDSELGEIPEGWRVVSFDEIMKFTPGTYIPKEKYEINGENFIYGSNSVMGNINQKTHTGPIIILAKIGTYCGAIRFSQDDCWINNNAGGIQGLNISTALIFEILKHFDFSIVQEGSGQPYINMSGLKMQKVAIPKDLNSEILKKISQCMDTIYLKIAGNQKHIQTLSKLRDTLLPKLIKGEIRVKGFKD